MNPSIPFLMSSLFAAQKEAAAPVARPLQNLELVIGNLVWISGPWVLTSILGAVGAVTAFLLFKNTKAGVIARATTIEAIRQPIFLLCWVLAFSLLVINTWLPFFSLGEDIKMLKDCGLATLLITGLLIACWTASTSVADEIEGKTAMTLLSKPVTRRQFVLGKYIGIVQAIAVYLLPLTIIFVGLLAYKVGYDARESSQDAPEAWERWSNSVQVLPGVVLLFCEICLLAAISVAISTRLPMAVNLTVCIATFVIAHLLPSLIAEGAKRLETVAFMARVLAVIFPSLEAFNTSAAVATGRVVPPDYLVWAGIYCVCYSSAAILLAFILFEDRDLA